MRLPGRLRDTTLGDVLGALFRESATGFLELIDEAGRPHRIELREGLIVRVESDEGPRLGDLLDVADAPVADAAYQARLGERLLSQGLVEVEQLSCALRVQNLKRLEFLFSLADASLRFRVPRPFAQDPTAPRPLGKEEFLVGRPRRRTPGSGTPVLPHRARALSVLGLPEGASLAEARAAFRKLASQYHPDRLRGEDPEERARLIRRFSEISSAFHVLSA